MTGHGPGGTMEVLQVETELAPMVALYQERKPARVLEIGCWDGGTLRVWLENAAPDAVVVAVDLEHRNREAYAAWVRDDVELWTHIGSSFEEDAKEFIARHGPYDWVFIDGDHGDYGVRNDINAVLPLISKGGLLLLHDITPPEGTATYPPGVAFEVLGEQYETWTYQDLTPAPWARGIGVVQL